MKFIYGVLASVIEFVWGGEGAVRQSGFSWLMRGGDDDGESRKYPRKVRPSVLQRRLTGEHPPRNSLIPRHPFAPPRLVFYRIIYCRELRPSPPAFPPAVSPPQNLGQNTRAAVAAALLLMDSSLMKYLDESARIYCAPARPALSRIVHDKPALISPRRSSPKKPLLPLSPSRSAVIPILFSATSIAR